MFGLLSVASSLGYVAGVPSKGPTTAVACVYRCPRCEVTERFPEGSEPACWLCGSEDVVEYRTLITSQTSLSGGYWPDHTETVDRLVERSV